MKIKYHPIIPPLLLLTFLSMLAYLILTPFLGFYSEDLFFSYVAHFYGIDGLIKSLNIDRPFNGYVLSLSYILLENNVFLWHLVAFFIRLFGGYLLFFLLLNIWPNKKYFVTFISLLFLLYPGFLQQTLPLGYQIHIITLTAWVTSITFTLMALKTSNKIKFFIYNLLSIIFQIFTFINMEIFIGMETLRLLLITHVLKIKISIHSLKRKILYWSPYLISTFLFISWRILVFKSIRPETDLNWVAQTYYSNPLWIAKIPLEIIYSFLHAVIFAFFIPITINFVRLPFQYSIISIALGITSFILLFLYFRNMKENNDNKNFGKKILFIGLVSVLAAIIPIIISGRHIRIFSVLDRYTITSILGVSFIIVGFLIAKMPNSLRKFIMILLISISITSHLMNGYWHRVMWDRQKDLWWQLYWRAPKIEANAMLILDFPKFTEDTLFKSVVNKVQWYRFYWAEEQIWTTGNLFFNYSNPPTSHFYGDFLEDKDIVEKIKQGSVETINNRNITYTRDFKNSIIITVPSDISCLKIINGDKLVKTGSPTTPPKQIFGEEPPHNWCYYFQKASLSRQFKDWDQLSKLKEEVINKGLKPKDPNEWLPFADDLR